MGDRVTTAQGKRGIWMDIFPDMENKQEIYLEILKTCFQIANFIFIKFIDLFKKFRCQGTEHHSTN